MTQDKTTIEQLLERNIRALNTKDIAAVLANQQRDSELVSGAATIRGHEQLEQSLKALWTAFPDGVYKHTSRIITDNAAAVEMVFTGTHTGPLATPNGDLPPTGKRVELHSANIMYFKDGLIASEHAYADQMEFMTQLGLVPHPAGSAAAEE